MKTVNFQFCDRLALIVLSITVLLSLVAFLPQGLLPGQVLKGYILIIGVSLSFVAWLVGRLMEGAFHIPSARILGALGILVLIYLFSALFSPAPYLSFFGEGFELGTFSIVTALALVAFLTSVLFTTKRRVFLLFSGFFSVYALIALFQIAHIIFPTATAMGVFFDKTATPVGLFSDLAFLSGAVLVGGTLLIEFFKPKKSLLVPAVIGSLVALFFVILANILAVWILVGVSMLFILICKILATRTLPTKDFPLMSFLLVLVALFFLLTGQLFGGFLAELLNMSFTAVNPSFGATLHVAQFSLHEHFVFGAGPNRFAHEWIVYRPDSVNLSQFWDIPFLSGAGYFATVALTSGLLGILAVVWFLFSFAHISITRVLGRSTSETNDPTLFGVFIFALYFILALIIASPGIAVSVCAFLFLGLLVAVLVAEGRIRIRSVSFLKEYRTGFFTILSIIILAMLAVTAISFATQRFVAIYSYNSGSRSANSGDMLVADAKIGKAIALSDLPVFERARVMIAARSLRNSIANSGAGSSSDAVKSELQNAVSVGESAAARAVALDPTDPTSYIVLGDFMSLLSELKIQNAFDNASDAYEKAIAIAPSYPKTYVSFASLKLASGDTVGAVELAEQALLKKPNYAEAFFLLARVDFGAGKTTSALERLQKAIAYNPGNASTYYQLGLLQYEIGDYQNAANAFRSTVTIDPSNLSAWYNLALSDNKIGETEEARLILEALKKRLPNNTDIQNAIMSNGTQPLPDPTQTDDGAPSTKTE